MRGNHSDAVELATQSGHRLFLVGVVPWTATYDFNMLSPHHGKVGTAELSLGFSTTSLIPFLSEIWIQ